MSFNRFFLRIDFLFVLLIVIFDFLYFFVVYLFKVLNSDVFLMCKDDFWRKGSKLVFMMEM